MISPLPSRHCVQIRYVSDLWSACWFIETGEFRSPKTKKDKKPIEHDKVAAMVHQHGGYGLVVDNIAEAAITLRLSSQWIGVTCMRVISLCPKGAGWNVIRRGGRTAATSASKLFCRPHLIDLSTFQVYRSKCPLFKSWDLFKPSNIHVRLGAYTALCLVINSPLISKISWWRIKISRKLGKHCH